jgi:ribosomal protein L32
MKTVSERITSGAEAVAQPSHGHSLEMAATAPLLTHCENCGAQLQGHWCAQCGQPAIDYRRSFRHVIADLLSEFLNWDSKFFKTIALLLVQPWRLTNEFLAGHRVRYVHPLRLYLLGSILFFFAATYGIKSAHFQPINLSPGALAELRAELERGNVAPEIRDKFEQALGGKPIPARERSELEQQLKNPDLPQIARYAIQQRLAHGDPLPDARAKLQEAIKALTPEMRARVESSLTRAQEDVTLFQSDKSQKSNDLAEWFQERAREKFGEHGTNIRLFLVALVSNLPYMMLVCIPLFACVLKLLYIRRRVFYMDHLIYALHVHTFAYLGIVLIVLATIGLGRAAPGPLAGWLTALLWLAFLVQIFLSIRRVYRQGWFISICKFLFGGFVYFLVLVAALAATFVITLATP